MFESLSEEAQELLALAQEEALRFNHNHIGTAHIVLGLLRSREEATTASVLRSLGLTLDAAREWIENRVGDGEKRERVSQPPFSPRLRRAIEYALQESEELRDESIEADHILLGVLREDRGLATHMLLDSGVDPKAVRRELLVVRWHKGSRPAWPSQ